MWQTCRESTLPRRMMCTLLLPLLLLLMLQWHWLLLCKQELFFPKLINLLARTNHFCQKHAHHLGTVLLPLFCQKPMTLTKMPFGTTNSSTFMRNTNPTSDWTSSPSPPSDHGEEAHLVTPMLKILKMLTQQTIIIETTPMINIFSHIFRHYLINDKKT